MDCLGIFVLCCPPFLEHTCKQCILWAVEMVVSLGFCLQGIRQRAGSSLSLVGHWVVQERAPQKNHQKVESSLIVAMALLLDQLTPALVPGKILPTGNGLLEAHFGSTLVGEDL